MTDDQQALTIEIPALMAKCISANLPITARATARAVLAKAKQS